MTETYKSARDPIIRYRITETGTVEIRIGFGEWTPTNITPEQINASVECGKLQAISQ